ncbi:GPI-anchored protein LORELEI-like protein [Carex littledalei]|uniref:GPI-anchored protein LORELEI-like protein n=1 Tax=Carex littledalei TaxID=544730 RepID=A0A833R914_9POAL|nr:GPI-anchored protein LORELEI-like protein [Carex littledalei]
MNLNRQLLVFRMVLFMGLIGLAVSSIISDDIFKVDRSGRNLAEQDKLVCDVDFKHQNYTIITSKCVAPAYDANNCCSAFKEFACPFVNQINDVNNNDCATIMLGYIQLYGEYPAGMFYSKCKEGKLGLECASGDTTSN